MIIVSTIWVAVNLYSIVNMVVEEMNKRPGERASNLNEQVGTALTQPHGLHSIHDEHEPSLSEGHAA